MPPKTAKGRGRKRKAEAESATAPSLDKAESNNLQQVLVPAESACSSEERIDSPTAVAPCSVLETEKKDSRGSSSVELYDDQKVIRIFQNELQKEGKDRIKFYESSGYFENILWSSFSSSVCVEHVLSMVIILNEKCRIGVNPFALLAESTLKCNEFFEYLADIAINDRMDDASQLCAYIVFFINTFQNLENSVVRQCCLKYLAIPMWKSLSSARLEEELAKSSQLRKQWESLEKLKSGISTQKVATPRRKGKGKKSVEADVSASNPDPKVLKALERQEKWLPSLLVSFFSILSLKKGAKSSATKFIEKFVELMIDLLSQLSTRRFSRAVLQEFHFIERCRLHFSEDAEFSNFRALVLMAETYLQFAVDDHTGKALTAQEIVELHNEKVFKLQKIAFTDYADKLKDVVFSSVGELCKQQNLLKYLNLVSDEEVYRICEKMSIVTDHSKDPIASKDVDYWKMLLVDCVAVRPSVLDSIHMLPLYPTEKLLWDSSLIPLSANYNEEDGLALPKLNLQFLTIHDYLLRNFNLFRLESAYEIREDLVDAIKRMGPKQASVATPVTFSGWARMALPTISVNIDEVAKPRLGETYPAKVTASVTIDLSRYTGDILREWEDLKEHDVCIDRPNADAIVELGSFESERKALAEGKKPKKNKDFQWVEDSLDFPMKYGVKYIRGGEVFEFRDEDNVVLNDPTRPDERSTGRIGSKRKLRIKLDPAQYFTDINEGRDCYESMNLIVRRKAKENNFKAILETIRDLMSSAAVGMAIPAWLHDIFLGYGNPASANPRMLLNDLPLEKIDFVDTFLDINHVLETFPNVSRFIIRTAGGEKNAEECQSFSAFPPPYKLELYKSGFPTEMATEGMLDTLEKIVIVPYSIVKKGPYPQDNPPLNSVRFTSNQVDAIRSGVSKGLTMIVGPPGTGKTDVAVQTIVNLYHNYPNEKILIVTHSNAALNDLFEKIMERDIQPRHLLRLGSGEADLRESLADAGAGGSGRGVGEAFNKQGRVNWSLARRLELLSLIERLATSLGVIGDVSNTCETAEYFFNEQVKHRIAKFESDVNVVMQNSDYKITVEMLFPFKLYFSDIPGQLFHGEWDDDLEKAHSCFSHIRNIFDELKDYRAFELLRTHSLRNDYLLTKQARIVAMTCTHAAMTRNRLVHLGFKYDSVIMEEAAQILEVETLIPLLLQDTDPIDGSRLKRVILLGDHYQLPPVVKHSAYKQFSHFDQSLFSRFIRLGVPHVLLDKQGRSRPEIADLYSWRYSSSARSLGNLPIVETTNEYISCNAGFLHNLQLIDVQDFKGKGEFAPTPYFYQNLGEAEYVVAVYQYMRLLGYPKSKITILTTYNGQKQLIRDVVNQRCQHPFFGKPADINTVDKYQGQQNDFILLSLVRTETVGHLRDIRRLIVALSRARLGLYVFCRKSIFEDCLDLKVAISKLIGSRPSQLQLVVDEAFPTSRTSSTLAKEVKSVVDVTAMGVLVYQMVQRKEQSMYM